MLITDLANTPVTLTGAEYIALMQNGSTYKSSLTQVANLVSSDLAGAFLPIGGGALTGPLTTSQVYGGSLSSSQLALTSTSAAGNSSNTDILLFETSNVLTGYNVPYTTGVQQSLNSVSRFDPYGRFFMTAGTPNTSYDTTYNATKPLNIPNQPLGMDSQFVITASYNNSGTNVNELYENTFCASAYVYGQYVSGSAVNGTGVAWGANSGAQGGFFSAIAVASGAYAYALVCQASASAASTAQVVSLLLTAGNPSYPANAYASVFSQTSGCNATYGLRFDGTSYNPITSAGTLIGVTGSSVSCTNGVDLRSATLSGTAFASTGFKVDGSGNVTPNAIVGVTTNSNASSGNVGEYVSSQIVQGSAVSLTSGTQADITTISLTAGDWDVWALACFNPALGTTTTILNAGINTSGTINTLPANGGTAQWIGSLVGIYVPTLFMQTRVSISTTTTIHFTALSVFTGSTNAAYGFIGARRRR